MKANIGGVDRAIRLLLSMILIIFFYSGVLKNNFGILALVLALILTTTSLLSYSPIYKLFNKSTIYHKKKEDK